MTTVDAAGTPWRWDASLYAGSAAHYATGRVAYPATLATALAQALSLDGCGVLVDVGCGPGSLTLLLAPLFETAIGVDADPDMLAAAAGLATAAGVTNTTWRHLLAEELPADLPAARVVSFAQSFHWFDRPRVLTAARAMLGPGGVVVHVGATTHEGLAGEDASDPLPHPRPPRAAVADLVRRRLGSDRRAGAGVRPTEGVDDEDTVFAAAGFAGPQVVEVPGRVVVRSVDEVVASVFSLSWSAPHLFGAGLATFDHELRELLTVAADNGLFAERMRSITLSIWR